MKIFYKALAIIMFISWSCENQDWEYKDFDYTACYFPYQTPVRTLILGDYDQGYNDSDNNHRFEIGAVLAGMYNNNDVRQVHYTVDESLLDNVSNVVALPAQYYQLETPSPVTIPEGSTKAVITVQLADAFFTDSLSFVTERDSVNYVIPLLLTQVENIDSILSGLPADGVVDPVRTSIADWKTEPKDYTLFGIKFINEYHGNYLRRGTDILTDSVNNITTNVYHAEYVEQDELIRVAISGRNSVVLSNRVRRGDSTSPGDIHMELTFDSDLNCVVSSTSASQFQVNGTGKFVKGVEEWGGNSRNAIYLDYSFHDTINNESHQVNDTLVVRDRDVVFESFTIILN